MACSCCGATGCKCPNVLYDPDTSNLLLETLHLTLKTSCDTYDFTLWDTLFPNGDVLTGWESPKPGEGDGAAAATECGVETQWLIGCVGYGDGCSTPECRGFILNCVPAVPGIEPDQWYLNIGSTPSAVRDPCTEPLIYIKMTAVRCSPLLLRATFLMPGECCPGDYWEATITE